MRSFCRPSRRRTASVDPKRSRRPCAGSPIPIIFRTRAGLVAAVPVYLGARARLGTQAAHMVFRSIGIQNKTKIYVYDDAKLYVFATPIMYCMSSHPMASSATRNIIIIIPLSYMLRHLIFYIIKNMCLRRARRHSASRSVPEAVGFLEDARWRRASINIAVTGENHEPMHSATLNDLKDLRSE